MSWGCGGLGVMYGSRSKVVSKEVWVCIFPPSINRFNWIIKIVGVHV